MEMRYQYLVDIKKYREEGCEIIYTDESWINENTYNKGSFTHNNPRDLCHSIAPKCALCDIYQPSGKGRRLILIDAGSAESGFIPNAGDAFVSGIYSSHKFCLN